MADLNGDGHKDMVSGSWPGEFYIFAGSKDGKFAAPVSLKDEAGKEINVGKASALVIRDWDKDGDQDLCVGTIDGTVYFLANEAGSFGQALELQADGKALSAHHCGPAIADWDGDGNLDLLLADGNGQVQFFKNQNAKGLPKLSAGVVLVTEAEKEGESYGRRDKIDVADWNNDGRLDLLLGDFRSKEGVAPEMTEAEKEAKAAAETALKPLQERYIKIYKEIQAEIRKEMGLKEEQKPSKELQKKLAKAIEENKALYALRVEQMSHSKILAKFHTPFTHSGKVWVFLRKAESTAVGAVH